MVGRLHSVYAGGTVDGPGIRFVVFFKGCPLRCQYCHNPDTWSIEGAKDYTVDELVQEALKYKGYFATGGGVTATGGEPLMQIDFLIEFFKELKKYKIHTAVDTSGIIFDKNNEAVINKLRELMSITDLFLLDIKHIDNEEHLKLTGKGNSNILEFAKFLSDNDKKMWIRHVIVPGITLNDEYLTKTKEFINSLRTVDKIEVLPYHTMGTVKYQQLGIAYPLDGVVAPTKDEVRHAKYMLGVIKDVA